MSGSSMVYGHYSMGLGVLLAGMLVLVLVAGRFYRRKFIGTGPGWLICLGAVLASVAITALRTQMIQSNGKLSDRALLSQFEARLWVLCGGLMVLFAVPFVLRLYNKWFGDNLTDAERLANKEGVRAWLNFGNLFLALLISLCGWQGFDYSFWAVLILTLGAVVAYPVFNIIGQSGGSVPVGPVLTQTDLSKLANDRERVLQLLEEGKINAEECAELLIAIGDSVPVSHRAVKNPSMTKGRKTAIVGALLVLAGFCLPWFSINSGKDRSHAMYFFYKVK